MKAEHRPMRPEDLPQVLALELCQEDKEEIRALSGEDPQETLKLSIECTPEPWVVLLEGQIVAVYGVSPAQGYDFGIPWFLSTGDHRVFAKTFLKGSKEVIERFHEEYTVLSNVVDSRHTVAVRWLKWLGFEFLQKPLTFHDPSVVFLQFVRYQQHV